MIPAMPSLSGSSSAGASNVVTINQGGTNDLNRLVQLWRGDMETGGSPLSTNVTMSANRSGFSVGGGFGISPMMIGVAAIVGFFLYRKMR